MEGVAIPPNDGITFGGGKGDNLDIYIHNITMTIF